VGGARALRLGDGDKIDVAGKTFAVLGVHGHTLGHIVNFKEDFNGHPLLFAETRCSRRDAVVCSKAKGTAAQMLASLDRMACQPSETVVCCAH
jgi:hydroxyacylglutathione hydrolase